MARALAGLPRCAQAPAEGRFSWDQIRALTRFARLEEDEALAAQATGKSAAALEWAARQARRISREEAQDEHDRARRNIPAWLMRLLRRRDGVCQFPGCSRRRWLQGHHLKHWMDGGRTDLDNLLLTCRPHHKLVHEFGWTVERGPDGCATFRKPTGQLYEVGPPALRPEVRRHLAAVPLLC